MNVLRQHLALRVTAILILTVVVSIGFYALEFTTWAETVRLTDASQQSGETRELPAYPIVLGASLLKASMLIGIPLLPTLAISSLGRRLVKPASPG